MSTLKGLAMSGVALLLATACSTPHPQSGAARYGIGSTPTAAQISAWNIDVTPDGAGLPAGSGTVAQGRVLFTQKCAACHGATGGGGPGGVLVGGQGSLASAKPLLTIGSFWPYATIVYDYINRAMPHDKPQSLKADEVYALAAFLLNQNGVIAADAVMDAQTLPKVAMSNRNGFTQVDPRPDVNGSRCMQDCK
jgi:S-disulfanyl-L-cysteine oxidoreductase SoxD